MLPAIFNIVKAIFVFIIKLFNPFIESIRRLFRFSITFKITISYTFIFSILLFLSSIIILISFKFFLLYETQNDLGNNMALIKNHIRDYDLQYDFLKEISKVEDVNITLFDEKKATVYATNKKYTVFNKSTNTEDLIKLLNLKLLVLNRPVAINEEIYFIQVSKDIITENSYLEVLLIVLLILNSISILFTIGYGSRVSKKMLLPIKRMTKTTKAITIKDLDTRLDVSGSQDELKELARTFNNMLDRIQKAYSTQDQFVSDASHELRTPISVIQGYANLLDRWGKNDKEVLDEAIETIKSESENMKDLTEKLLLLAKSDKNLLKINKEYFSINELLQEIVKETSLIDSKHEIVSHTEEKININADRKLLKQALRVFIDNSIKFTPENGSIKLSSYSRRKYIVIEIEDTGIGIPKEDIPHIFERFYRSDKSRTKETGGSGLGLSIAKLVIDIHNGKIEVKSNVSIGTKITIYLPNK